MFAGKLLWNWYLEIAGKLGIPAFFFLLDLIP